MEDQPLSAGRHYKFGDSGGISVHHTQNFGPIRASPIGLRDLVYGGTT